MNVLMRHEEGLPCFALMVLYPPRIGCCYYVPLLIGEEPIFLILLRRALTFAFPVSNFIRPSLPDTVIRVQLILTRSPDAGGGTAMARPRCLTTVALLFVGW